MSIKAYVGRMGSGKSYELVSVVILAALKGGRRVVSNVAGLDYPAMVDMLVAEGVPAERIGQLVQVSHEQVSKPEFWRTDKDAEKGVEAFVQPGDLIALDEIWRFWSGFSDRKMPERVMNFFRMHRHFTHPETGVTCDVALITQDIMDVARRVRAVVEETYQMTKLTAVGSTSRYRVDVFAGTNLRKKPLRSLQRKYEAKYFPLYSSHSQKTAGGAEAREENIDDRGNLLKGALFRVVIPVGFVVASVCVWYLWKFFHPEPPPAKKTAAGQEAGKTPSATKAAPLVPNVSARWRVVGIYILKSGEYAAILEDPAMGVRRYLYRPPVKMHGWQMALKTPEGEMVTNWSGSAGNAAPMLPQP